MPAIDPVLKKKIELIEDMPFDESDAIYLVLMVAGKKPASFLQVWSEPWRQGDVPFSYPQASLDRLGASLAAVGLAYAFKPRITTAGLDQPYDAAPGRTRYHELIDVYVAQDDTMLVQLITAREAHNELALGTLLGYPKTAVDAFVNGTPFDEDSLPLLTRLSPEWQFVAFRFSQGHWQEEFMHVKEWARTLHELSPLLYDAYLRHFSVVHPWVYDEVTNVLNKEN